jgi:hypothetical protein
VIFSRFILRPGGRRVAVFTRRGRRSAVLRMLEVGAPVGAICAALDVSRGRVGAIRAAAGTGSIWGELAGVVAQEMRRAA